MLFDMNVNHRLTPKLNQHNVRDSFTATSASVSGLTGKLGTHEVRCVSQLQPNLPSLPIPPPLSSPFFGAVAFGADGM